MFSLIKHLIEVNLESYLHREQCVSLFLVCIRESQRKKGECYLLNESEIVADQHHSSFKVVYSVGQSVDGLDIQMIGGFV